MQIHFVEAKLLLLENIHIRPLVIDHSAADSYMFVIEAEGKACLIYR